jgi:hypothetical protein
VYGPIGIGKGSRLLAPGRCGKNHVGEFGGFSEKNVLYNKKKTLLRQD